MILIDTSIWINHLRHGLPDLSQALEKNTVLIHPWVIGELACGTLKNRQNVLGLLKGLPESTVASPSEVLILIESHQLMGRGIGFVDAQLLTSAKLSRCGLWSADRKLKELAIALNIPAA